MNILMTLPSSIMWTISDTLYLVPANGFQLWRVFHSTHHSVNFRFTGGKRLGGLCTELLDTKCDKNSHMHTLFWLEFENFGLYM